jgi:hypothetical protein
VTHAPKGAAWLVWLETSTPAAAMRESMWLYPAIESLHIAGFVVLVGAAVMFDLRLLGLSPGLSARGMADHLLPWSRMALLLVVPTGALMFSAHATEFADNPAFRVKLLLLAAAGLNAGLFHWKTFASVADWDQLRRAPVLARLAAVLSLVLWTGVIAAGRLIAYL